MTVPNVSKLRETGGVSPSVVLGGESTDLVLMYLPSLVRSLSEVAFSEPARSIRLCKILLVSVFRILDRERSSPAPRFARSCLLLLAISDHRDQASVSRPIQVSADHSNQEYVVHSWAV
jgi:hypothetical protein